MLRRVAIRARQAGVGAYELLAGALLALAAWSTYAPPSAALLIPGEPYVSLWNRRVVSGASIFEALFLVLFAVWAIRAYRTRDLDRHALDLPIAVFVGLLCFLQGIALGRNGAIIAYQQVDAERIVVFLIGYFA